MKSPECTQRADGLCPRAAWHFSGGLDGRAGCARARARPPTLAAARERAAAIKAGGCTHDGARPRRRPAAVPSDHARWSYSGTRRCSPICFSRAGRRGRVGFRLRPSGLRRLVGGSPRWVGHPGGWVTLAGAQLSLYVFSYIPRSYDRLLHPENEILHWVSTTRFSI